MSEGNQNIISVAFTHEQLEYLEEILAEGSDRGCDLGNLPATELWTSIWWEVNNALEADKKRRNKLEESDRGE